ncbi:hypothetical protein H7992_18830 [Sporosarcina sp. resist]|uniref:SAF domain-containing protein n=1 Tax=Sporosarcina sp. resist TaxID=2762563 RepID=UPI00164E2A96|nr:hypothetical protein H7992_18830 [Sporosarcina sp. resist]
MSLGVDSAFSIEQDGIGGLVVETESLKFRQSIYVVKDMKAGEVFTIDNSKVIRLGHGLAPKYLELILGKLIN